MITASSSPKRRILTPEHGRAYGVGRYLLSRIGQAYGSGIVSFFFRQPPRRGQRAGNSPKASGLGCSAAASPTRESLGECPRAAGASRRNRDGHGERNLLTIRVSRYG